jgi:hypothetical protein
MGRLVCCCVLLYPVSPVSAAAVVHADNKTREPHLTTHGVVVFLQLPCLFRKHRVYGIITSYRNATLVCAAVLFSGAIAGYQHHSQHHKRHQQWFGNKHHEHCLDTPLVGNLPLQEYVLTMPHIPTLCHPSQDGFLCQPGVQRGDSLLRYSAASVRPVRAGYTTADRCHSSHRHA